MSPPPSFLDISFVYIFNSSNSDEVLFKYKNSCGRSLGNSRKDSEGRELNVQQVDAPLCDLQPLISQRFLQFTLHV